MQYVIGVDEAGRGPLAGPVAVGLVVIPSNFDWDALPGVGDSKTVTPKKRAVIYAQATALAEQGHLHYQVRFGSAQEIDTEGIAVVIRNLIAAGLAELAPDPKGCLVKLDGSLKAPNVYPQETIIKGDSSELVIGLASILAKETRDRAMIEFDKLYPQYELRTHKGYGTKLHRAYIREYGLSPIHRISYCKNCLS